MINKYEEGREARRRGVRKEDNPHPRGTEDHERWLKGWYSLSIM